MVESNAEKVATSDSDSETTPMVVKKPAKGIEEGRYKLVGWAADTTGKRLIDEICQIAAYTTESQFSQYIMPFSDIRLLYRRRHSIRVMSLGKYRMLQDMRTNKFVKTKSEVTALVDFIEWLEKNRGENCDGIILVFHEIQKSIPAMLLESLRRYNLLERFSKVVKGFANSFDLAQSKCANTTKAFTLRVMTKILLNKTNDLSSAVDRAQACFEIVMHLGQSERTELESKGSGDAQISDEIVVNLIRPFTQPIEAEEEEIKDFKLLLERQNSFKPVFGELIKGSPKERKRASYLRRILAQNNIDFEQAKAAFESDGGKDGLTNIVKNKIAEIKEEDLTEVLEILDCFFDPEKQTMKPKPKFFQNNRRPQRRFRTRSMGGGGGKDKNANQRKKSIDVKQEAPEVTSPEPEAAQEPPVENVEIKVEPESAAVTA